MGTKSSNLILSIVVGMSAAFFFWYPISDGDIFWHLAAGREIVRTHAIPHTDPFSFTSGNFQWVDLHWLFQAGMYGIQSLLGLSGVLVANSLFLGLAAALLFFVSVRPRTAIFSALLWIAALYEVRYLAPHRPIMVSLLLLAAFIGCLDLYGRKNKVRYLAVLLPLQVVWTNAQPLFVLGPCVAAAWLAGESVHLFLLDGAERHAAWKRVFPLAGTTVVLLLASFVNPYGLQAFRLAFMLFHRLDPSSGNPFSFVIDENRPLPALFGTPDVHYAWATIAITAVAGILLAMRPGAIRFPFLFAAAAGAFLAYRAERNIILYFFMVLPFINIQLGAVVESLKTRPMVFVRSIVITVTAVAALLACFAITSHTVMLLQIRGSGPVAPFSFPDGSVEYLAAHPIAGDCFNADRYGGYLLWKRYPPRKVFIDTRYAIRPSSFLTDYCAILDHPALFRPVCEKYGITSAILPAAFVTRYIKLSVALLEDREWRLAYTDGTEALFVKDTQTSGLDLGNAATVDSLSHGLAVKWQSNTALRQESLRHLADFLAAMGKKERADRVYHSIAN
jgi:hypothetical protein